MPSTRPHRAPEPLRRVQALAPRLLPAIRPVRRIAWLFLLLTLTLPAREPFSPSDLWTWRQAAEPEIDAAGTRVVYVEHWQDRITDTACANLWQVSVDGRRREAVTSGSRRDRSPHWSPDGTRIAYLSDSEGSVQVRIHSMDSGEDRALAAGLRPLALAWSPDGESIAFTAMLPPRVDAPWAPPALLPFLVPSPAAVELFVMPAAGGAPRQLSHDGMAVRGEPAWMPRGDWILTAAGTAADTEIYGTRAADGEVRKLTHHPGPDDGPVPSPDGSKIAWIAAEPNPAAYSIRRLWVMGRDGEHVKVLTGQLDRDVVAPHWSSDSRTIYFLADDHGSTHVYAARTDGTVRQVTSLAGRLEGLSLADSGRAVTVRSTATEGGELVSFAVDLPGGIAILAAPNQHLLAEREMAIAEAFHYDSSGNSIDAWLIRPPHFDASRQYPLLLDVRDDPRSMCGGEFQLRAQILAARGFAVLCANPRGTPGYGEVFGSLLRTRHPGDDFDDLMRGVDAAISRGGVDGHRLVIAGSLLAAWAIGHTDRFRAAVARRPIVDWTADVALAPDGDRRAGWMGAMPWENPEQYVKHGPIYFAQNFTTPTLVIAGDSAVESQELEFALQRRKVESALVRLEDEHRPSRQVLEMEATLAWLEKHTAAAQ